MRELISGIMMGILLLFIGIYLSTLHLQIPIYFAFIVVGILSILGTFFIMVRS
jgi:hypothetical protein